MHKMTAADGRIVFDTMKGARYHAGADGVFMVPDEDLAEALVAKLLPSEPVPETVGTAPNTGTAAAAPEATVPETLVPAAPKRGK